MEYKRLEDILDYIQPTNYIVESEKYDDSFKTPVLTAGKSFLLGYTDEINGIFNADFENPIILFDDFTTDYKWVDFAFKVKSSACKILIPKTNVNLKYVFYAMKYVNIDTKLHKRYWISIFSKQLIPYPDNEIQTKIVIELDKIHNLIKNNEEELMKFDEIVKSQFIEIFGKINSFEKMRTVCNRITDFVASGSFASLKENVKYYDDPNYAILVKTADFANNFSKFLTYIDEHAYNFLHNSNLYGGELILPNIGASIGKAFIVPKLGKKMSLAPNSIMVEPCQRYKTEYLYYYFLSEYGQEKLYGLTTATAMPKFNKTQLKDVEIISPSLELQNKFADFVQQIDKSKITVQKQIDLLEELLEFKMNEYFGDRV